MRRSRALVPLVASVAICALLYAPCVASAQPESPNDPSSAELVEKPNEYDGKTVTFTGEAITAAMVRGENAWIHVNDDAYYLQNVEEGAPLDGYNSGMAIWLPASEAAKIGVFGDYTHEGDVVTVEGVFNAACPEHGGDMDIHATTLAVGISGRSVIERVGLAKFAIALAMLLIAGVLWFFARRVEHRERIGLFRS